MLLAAPQGDSRTPEHRQLSAPKRPLTTSEFLAAGFAEYRYRFRKPHSGWYLFRAGLGEGILPLHAEAWDGTGVVGQSALWDEAAHAFSGMEHPEPA